MEGCGDESRVKRGQPLPRQTHKLKARSQIWPDSCDLGVWMQQVVLKVAPDSIFTMFHCTHDCTTRATRTSFKALNKSYFLKTNESHKSRCFFASSVVMWRRHDLFSSARGEARPPMAMTFRGEQARSEKLSKCSQAHYLWRFFAPMTARLVRLVQPLKL